MFEYGELGGLLDVKAEHPGQFDFVWLIGKIFYQRDAPRACYLHIVMWYLKHRQATVAGNTLVITVCSSQVHTIILLKFPTTHLHDREIIQALDSTKVHHCLSVRNHHAFQRDRLSIRGHSLVELQRLARMEGKRKVK